MDVDWSEDEVVEHGAERSRPPVLARWGGRLPLGAKVIAVAVAGSGFLALSLTSRPHHATPPVPDATPAPAAEQVDTDRAMALIETSARAGTPLHDYIRSDSTKGACPQVSVGSSPQLAVAGAIVRTLPGYSVRDTSRTIDQFTALCAMSVRAVDTQGSVLVVSVAAPQQSTQRAFTQLTVGARTESRTAAVSIATALTRSGWSITVGVLGPLADQPSSADLQRLSQDPALLW